MLRLNKQDIPEENIKDIITRKQILTISIINNDDSEITLQYETEKEFKKDKDTCKNWLENIKPKLDKNKEEYIFKNMLLNALDTLIQICDYYIDDYCDGCKLKDESDTCIFEYGFAPILWELHEDEPFVEIKNE